MNFENYQITGGNPIFAISDMDKALTFYGKLGFNVDWKYGDPAIYASITLGNSEVEGKHVHMHISLHDATSNIRSMIYIFINGEIDELYNDYNDRGIEFSRPIDTYDYGMREFVVEDPFGNILTFGKDIGN